MTAVTSLSIALSIKKRVRKCYVLFAYLFVKETDKALQHAIPLSLKWKLPPSKLRSTEWAGTLKII